MEEMDERLRGSGNYEVAIRRLSGFEKMMKIVEKYPIESAYRQLPPSRYTTR